MRPAPLYKVNERVVHSSNTSFVYSGTIVEIISDPSTVAFPIERALALQEADPDYLDYPVYIIAPDSSPGVMSFEELQAWMQAHLEYIRKRCKSDKIWDIVVDAPISRYEYNLITNYRRYVCCESELMRESDDPEPRRKVVRLLGVIQQRYIHRLPGFLREVADRVEKEGSFQEIIMSAAEEEHLDKPMFGISLKLSNELNTFTNEPGTEPKPKT